jgi:hypothetical protein
VAAMRPQAGRMQTRHAQFIGDCSSPKTSIVS